MGAVGSAALCLTTLLASEHLPEIPADCGKLHPPKISRRVFPVHPVQSSEVAKLARKDVPITLHLHNVGIARVLASIQQVAGIGIDSQDLSPFLVKADFDEVPLGEVLLQLSERELLDYTVPAPDRLIVKPARMHMSEATPPQIVSKRKPVYPVGVAMYMATAVDFD